MTTPPKDAPVTEAGRRLLRTLSVDDYTLRRAAEAILAIEVEAATAARSDEIDVETLADELSRRVKAYRSFDDSFDVVRDSDRHAARQIAARLRSEQGERTPRVDSEIDAT
jgi:hypothetical protein